MDERRLDPEFSERMEAFLQEVRSEPGQELPARTRSLAVLAALLGCQGLDEFRRALSEALEAGLAPVEVKEAVYQAVDYLGIGRVRPFLTAVNEILLARGVALPLPGQATTTMEDRLQKGEQAQVDIFGEGMRGAWKQGHVNRWLAANCFGDYYTRGGLDLKDREMITFCFLAAQGGCEPQLTAHAGGNMNLGNDEAFLTRVVSQCLPYIGYPRSLNALACVRKAAEARKNS
ncbi:MAG TPA: carboxymuconolactone decarboxylase family protein [Candidatus Spyradocola merdavium]|nr:carboxymuconolactone decarboxylase family protein [Candidatus Spyradocola merdavium]